MINNIDMLLVKIMYIVLYYCVGLGGLIIVIVIFDLERLID